MGDIHDTGMNKEASTSIYWPMLMKDFEGEGTMVGRDLAFAIRTPRAGSESFMREVRQAVWSVDPNLPLAEVHTRKYFYRKAMARSSFTLVMLAVAGGMALLLGLWACMASSPIRYRSGNAR